MTMGRRINTKKILFVPSCEKTDKEVSSFLNMIMFEKEEDSIDTDASSSTSLFEKEDSGLDRQGGLLVLVHDLVRVGGQGGLLLLGTLSCARRRGQRGIDVPPDPSALVKARAE